MKILDLPLKKELFDMVKDNDKREDYRELKPYWLTKLFNIADSNIQDYVKIDKKTAEEYCNHEQTLINDINNKHLQQKDFTHVRIKRGRTDECIIFRIEDITIGVGNEEWGAPTNNMFIIKFANQTLKEEFNQKVTETLITKENEYSENDNIDLDKVTNILTNELRMFFSDYDLNFKANDNPDDFTLLPADEHTEEILKTIE